MECRKKWILLIAIFCVISALVTIYSGNSNTGSIIYQPREVKIDAVHLADI